MSEPSWFKWLVVSTILHALALGVCSVQLTKSHRKIDLSSYSVNLVGSMGGGPKASTDAGMTRGIETPAKEPSKPEKKAEAKKQVKEKPQPKPKPERARKDEVSIAKKKVPAKEPPKPAKKEALTKDDLDALKQRLSQIRKRSDYVDISKRGDSAGTRAGGQGAAGLPFSGDGTGRPLDLVTQKYYMDVSEKVKAAWRMPGSGLKKLLTEVTIKVRKDGRLMDISVDKRSGNIVWDESVMRALKAADPYPPIPPSLNLDTIEIPFRFRPEDMS